MSCLHHVKILKYQRFNVYSRNIQYITKSLIINNTLCCVHGVASQNVMLLQTSSTKAKYTEKNRDSNRKEETKYVVEKPVTKCEHFLKKQKENGFQISFQTVKRFFYEKSLIFIPIHLITTSLWFAFFYIFCDGGLKCVALKGMEQFESYFDRNKWGKLAVVLLLMKLVSPLRYAMSIGITIYLSKLFTKAKMIQKVVNKKKET